MYRLTIPGFINPLWFNQVRYGQYTGKVLDARTVELQGEKLILANPEEAQLVSGQEVYIVLDGSFYCETIEEYQAREARAEALRQARRDHDRTRRNLQRAEAENFNAQLYVPVKWKSGMKDVLSGLSARSNGDGCNAATVAHIWLQEPLHDGRLHRDAGDFLCTSTSGDNGKQWSGQKEYWRHDGDGNRYQVKVSCKSCLKIAEKWNH